MGAKFKRKSFGLWVTEKILFDRNEVVEVTLDAEGQKVDETKLVRTVHPRPEGDGFSTTSRFSNEEYFYPVGQELKIKGSKTVEAI